MIPPIIVLLLTHYYLNTKSLQVLDTSKVLTSTTYYSGTSEDWATLDVFPSVSAVLPAACTLDVSCANNR